MYTAYLIAIPITFAILNIEHFLERGIPDPIEIIIFAVISAIPILNIAVSITILAFWLIQWT